MKIRISFCVAAALLFLSHGSFSQTCSPPPIVANAKSYNIFSPEQEMILGELVIERTISDYREIDDPVLQEYVDKIAEKLIRHLPPTGLVYHFHIIDLNDTNAFNLPGGHVFLSRKIIAFAKNEDELAGVMAHELGHATVHHGAIRTSEQLKKILKVTAVTDRKDINNKYNLLIENFRTKTFSESDDHGDAEQLEADRIGLFALAGAGYDPEGFFSLFSRLTESKAKGGGWLSDLFGTRNPEEKRLREFTKATSALPAECREGRVAKPTEDFLNWQASVITYRETDRNENIDGLVFKKEITPKLLSDISYINVSADGKLILAQNDFAINIIDRQAEKVLLQIRADGAENAQLSPDNKEVSFTTRDLHFERWNIEQKKALEVRELFVRRDCWEHAVSPDGKYLACVYPDRKDFATTNLRVIDTETGADLWEKKKFYELGYFEYVTWFYRSGRDDEHSVNMFRIQFSPDSHYVVFSRTNKYRFRLTLGYIPIQSSENTAYALDLSSMKGVGIGGDLEKVTARSYAFIGSDKIVGATESKLEAGGVFSFPSGKKLQNLELGAEEVKSTANSNYVVLKPLATGTTGIFDIKKNAVVAAINRKDLTAWGDMVIFESADGKVVCRQTTYNQEKKVLDGKDVAKVELPPAPIYNLDVSEVSDDFRFLMLSSDTRGGVWDLTNGQRKVFTRGFKGGVVDTKGISVADFPQLNSEKHSLAAMDSTSGNMAAFKDLPQFGTRQYRQFLVARKVVKEKDIRDLTKGAQYSLSPDEKFDLQTVADAKLEVQNWIDDKVVWSHEFKGRLPRYSFDGYSGRLILYWRLGTEEGKARVKELPQLDKKANSLGDKEDDYLVEIIDAFQGKTVATLPIETGKGSISLSWGRSEGNWLAVRDSEGRVLIYSLSDGELKHRFFGSGAILNRGFDQVAVQNLPGEVSVYDLRDGERAARYRINGDLVFMRFSPKGDRLFLLSDRQAAYVIDVPKPRSMPRTP
jgi:WD40 repeat protein